MISNNSISQSTFCNDSDFRELLWGLVQSNSTLPTKLSFNGGNENPVVFSNKLENYENSFSLNENKMFKLAQEYLKESVQTWTSIFREKWTTFTDFKRDFLGTYWTAKKQGEVCFRISNEKYEPFDIKTMLTYFSSFVNQAKMLHPRMPEDDLLTELVQHFRLSLQTEWSGRADRNIQTFAAFLIKQESIKQNAGTKEQIQTTSQST